MINPENTPIDPEEQRLWIVEHKQSQGLSWNQLAPLVDVKAGTLSSFGGKTYKGDLQRIGEKIFRYRQNLTMQSQIKVEAPEIPGFFETRTARDVINLLTWAQRGRMTMCAGGPGLGKTTAATHYTESVSNAWLITISPAIRTVPALTMEVLWKMGDRMTRRNNFISRYVKERLEGTAGLLIFDDAQHLNVEQIEEIRSWHDQTRIGVAFLGNREVIQRMEGGSRQAAFAQLYSRVGMRMIRDVPLAEDIELLADEWRIDDEKTVAFLHKVGNKPGGLRSCTFTLEIANMLARANGGELTLDHVNAAWMQLSTRPVAS